MIRKSSRLFKQIVDPVRRTDLHIDGSVILLHQRAVRIVDIVRPDIYFASGARLAAQQASFAVIFIAFPSGSGLPAAVVGGRNDFSTFPSLL